MRDFLESSFFQLAGLAPAIWIGDALGRGAMEQGGDFGSYALALIFATAAGAWVFEPLRVGLERIYLGVRRAISRRLAGR